MDNDFQKIIASQMKILPNDVKEAILSVNYKTRLQEITSRQKLLIDQAAKLDTETTLVMIGLEPLADYVKNLQSEMEINETRAKEIAMDVSSTIFKPIRESLRTMNEEMAPEEDIGMKMAEPEVAKFTNSNEANLNRDQILKEIENPSIIESGKTAVEIRPKQEVETLPGESVKDISHDIVTNKMTGTTMVSSQVIEAKSEIKLPVVEKKQPFGGVDPYREPIS